jgi:hypothetical protein
VISCTPRPVEPSLGKIGRGISTVHNVVTMLLFRQKPPCIRDKNHDADAWQPVDATVDARTAGTFPDASRFSLRLGSSRLCID